VSILGTIGLDVGGASSARRIDSPIQGSPNPAALPSPTVPRLVFDSDVGRVCPTCGLAPAECTCGRRDDPPETDGVVRVRRELRKGKPVAAAAGVPLPRNDRKALLKELKRRFGTGGTVTDDGLELQGDLRDALLEELRKRGFSAVAAGG
jgi:translation initiation factor 1